MADSHSTPAEDVSVERNEELYTDDGALVGVAGDATGDGFEVETVASVSLEHGDAADSGQDTPGQGFGEGYIMWRCTECGEMGELGDGLPEECPHCGAPKEAIAKERED